MILVLNSGLFGRNVRFLRTKRRMTEESFAETMEITPSAVSATESGELLDIDAALAARICDFFGFDMMAMLDFDFENPKYPELGCEPPCPQEPS